MSKIIIHTKYQAFMVLLVKLYLENYLKMDYDDSSNQG